TRRPLEPEDALLLCSDGLTDLVTGDQILAVVRAARGAPERVTRELVAAALAAGGKDNVSVLFAAGPRFGAAGRAAPAPARAPAPRAALAVAVLPFLLGALVGTLIALWLSRREAPSPAPPPAAGAVSGRVLRVGRGQPYRSIADALDAARAGDTV